jgi:PPM family protein phosphatase
MLEACAVTDQGCVRSNNEDYYLVRPDLGLYIVADGMGGARAGEHASRLAAETAALTLARAPQRNGEALLRAFEEANRRVLEAASLDPDLAGMGTTLVAALDTGDEIQVASVGDSRAYLAKEGCLRTITEDQSWVSQVGRLLGLDEAALRTHPLRHMLTMAIGAADKLEVNRYRLNLGPDALLLLCSDGLHGVVEYTTLSVVLAAAPAAALEQVAGQLIAAAKTAGAPDNVTALLIRQSPGG